MLTEVAVILGWVAQTYPAARLKPPASSPGGDFFAFSRMQAFNLYLASTVHIAFAHLFRAERWADSAEAIAEMNAKTPTVLGTVLKLVEDQLADGRPWVMGEQYTVADPYLYVMSRWLGNGTAPAARPGSPAWLPIAPASRAARRRQRPWRQKD